MALSAARRAAPAAPGDARRTTRAAVASTCGCGWPSGWPTSSAPPTSPARPGCRRTRGARVPRWASSVDLHSIPPVTGHAHPRQRLLGRARGRPLRATGSTATCCTSAGSRSAPALGSARAARSCPGPSSAATPRSRPGRRSSARSRRGSTGPARPPSPSAAPAARGRESRPDVQAALGGGVRRDRDGDLAAAHRGRPRGARRGCPRPAGHRPRSATPPWCCSRSCRCRHWSAWSCSPR